MYIFPFLFSLSLLFFPQLFVSYTCNIHSVSDSWVIHIHISILFQIIFPYRLLEYWEQFSVLYSRSLLVSYVLYSSTLAWKIPGTEEPGRLQSMGSRRVGHDWVTSLSFTGEGNGNPLQCSCLENPRDSGAWWAAIYGATQSQTRLKRLSSSSSSIYINPNILFF